jgi:1,5-anhydro-D-fructose reductase (1,5-anhydro-D-mannitol-forming)
MPRSSEKVADYARRHGVPRWDDDADALIADPEVDAVYIAAGLPPRLRAASSGCGQPGLRGKADGAHCAGVRRDDRGVRPRAGAAVRGVLPSRDAALRDGAGAARQRCDSGCRGRSSSGFSAGSQTSPPPTCPYRLRPEISGGGLFVDLGSHTLDLLDWFLGPVTHVSGVAANQGGYYDADEGRDEVETTGTAGRLRFPTLARSRCA